MPAWVAPAIMAAGQAILSLVGQARQNKKNKELAQFQHDANKQLLDQQLEYNTPKNQMSRFQQAGLNPHLIYGQGNPGNQSAPLTYPEIKAANMQNLDSLAPTINQTMLTQSQVQANNAKTVNTYVKTELDKLKKEVVARNPLLNDSAFTAAIDSMVANAVIKTADASVKQEYADWYTGTKEFTIDGVKTHGPAGILKMETELKTLIQKYDLDTKDLQLKAAILNGKEFQNDLLEIQTKWMKDGSITPQHIFQFIQLLLMRVR